MTTEEPGTAAGLELARQALAAAQAEAVRRGLPPSAPASSAAGSAKSLPSQYPSQYPSQTIASGYSGRTRAEDRRSGPGPDDRDPQMLEGAIPRLLAARGWQARAAVSDVLTSWAEVVGEEVAAHCEPENFLNGRLTVRADSTAWATQLRLLMTSMKQRLNERLLETCTSGDPAVVTEIRVLGPDAPSWRKGALSVRGRGPRDTYG